jgi:hypothetical protein
MDNVFALLGVVVLWRGARLSCLLRKKTRGVEGYYTNGERKAQHHMVTMVYSLYGTTRGGRQIAARTRHLLTRAGPLFPVIGGLLFFGFRNELGPIIFISWQLQ